jgi:hypothetical protein
VASARVCALAFVWVGYRSLPAREGCLGGRGRPWRPAHLCAHTTGAGSSRNALCKRVVRGGGAVCGGGKGGRSGVRGVGRCVSERECNEGLQSWANCRSSIYVTIQVTSQHMTGCAPFSLPNLRRAFVQPCAPYLIPPPILQSTNTKSQYQKPNTKSPIPIHTFLSIRFHTHVPRSVRVVLVAPYIIIALSYNASFTMPGTIPNPRPFPWPLMFEARRHAGKSKGGRQKGRWKETGCTLV